MPRAIIVDDNASAQGGHYNELSSLLLHAANEMGYEPVLVAHESFDQDHSLPENCKIIRCFTTRRMARWSCGFDGRSSIARNIDAAPLNRTLFTRCLTLKDEWRTRKHLRPSEMLRCWASGLTSAIERLLPTGDDRLIFQTADDFMMVALASALQQFHHHRFSIKAVFHYAVHGVHSSSILKRKAFDQQLNAALSRLSQHHDLTLFATTDSLAQQMNDGAISKHVHAIPYPIRTPRSLPQQRPNVPRIVVGGMHRIEQGRHTVASFLEAIYEPFVKSGRCSLTIRIDPKRWQRIVPRSLHSPFAPAIQAQIATPNDSNQDRAPALAPPALDVRPPKLAEEDYFLMISSADLGVLLYDADRYKVRCSGVLLEFLTRGIPVIVPSNCWLGDIVEAYNQVQRIGYTYHESHQIPGFIEHFLDNRYTVQTCAKQVSLEIAQKHSPTAVLKALLSTKHPST